VSDTLLRQRVLYKWRLELEHNLKARNGGRGLSDASVKSSVNSFYNRHGDHHEQTLTLATIRFVDQFTFSSIFFGDTFSPANLHKHQRESPKWIGKGLSLFLDDLRTVTGATSF
jgi:D-glycerate 3-kinase